MKNRLPSDYYKNRYGLSHFLAYSRELLLLWLLCLLLLLGGCSNSDKKIHGESTLLRDNGYLLEDIAESMGNHLAHIRDSYSLEVVVATVETIGGDETIEDLTARLFTQWNIGRKYEGRGLLLLLADREKEVRLEVGLALEGVFTDLFTGYIEDKHLKSYFLSDQLSLGLVAVIEEIEARAALLARNKTSSERVNSLDLHFLSAGGGAGVELEKYEMTKVGQQQAKYLAGRTVDEAWQTLLQSWRNKNRDPDIGVYTPVTRRIYRAYINQPDRRFEEDVRTWGDKSYEIIQDKKYAVIFFGNKKGWDNAPFLFCKTKEGWQFDMVHQRKFVRMGRAPSWGIERGDHPYIHLLSRCPYWMGQDIPRRGDDIYDVNKDEKVVGAIVTLEEKLQKNGKDFDTLLKLGTLYTLTSMNQQRITLLKKAGKLKPDHPEVLKNLAIAHVDAHYQYKTALSLMDKYVHLRPSDAFGHFFRGYLQLMMKQYSEAILSLEQGLTLEPNDIYGLCKLARTHYLRKEIGDRQRAKEIFNQAHIIAPNHIRVRWLRATLF